MRILRTLYHFMKADFLERVRRHSFLITLGITVWAAFMFVPPMGSAYGTFIIEYRRGFYNSPWIGTLYGLVAATLLVLFGFYLTKNTIARDNHTRVGQLIATTPTSKALYMLGKWLSNLSMLTVILCVMTGMALIMQLVRAEDTTIQLWALIAPIWFMGLPILAITSAVAVLFESIPLLRGGLGNIVYFFIWGPVLIGNTFGALLLDNQVLPTLLDPTGMMRSVSDIKNEILINEPGLELHSGGLIGPLEGHEVTRFRWDGIDWTLEVALERLIWLGVAGLIALSAAIPFHRFDPARESIASIRNPGCLAGFWKSLFDRTQRLLHLQRNKSVEFESPIENAQIPSIHLTDLDKNASSSRFIIVLLAELRMMLKGQKWWWFAGALGLIIAGFATPLDVARKFILPAAWLWPLAIWSSMGVREKHHFTDKLVFSSAYPLRRQLPATWLAGVLLTLFMGSGLGLNLLLNAELGHFLVMLVGSLFIPTLALALGIWSRSSRLFEIIYLIWWYLCINELPAFDFMGITSQIANTKIPLIYLGMTLILLAFAFGGRWKHLQE
jgi:hypothetical protein